MHGGYKGIWTRVHLLAWFISHGSFQGVVYFTWFISIGHMWFISKRSLFHMVYFNWPRVVHFKA